MVIAIAVLITFSAIYQVMKQDTLLSQNMVKTDAEMNVAESAATKAVGLLMTNTKLSVLDAAVDDGAADGNGYYQLTDPDTPVEFRDDAGNLLGWYMSKVKQVNWTPEMPSPAYHIVTYGWSVKRSQGAAPGLDGQYVTAHTWARFANAGDYFAGIKGDITINPGADLSSAKLYGRNVTLKYTPGVADSIKIQEIGYLVDLNVVRTDTGDTVDWPTDNSTQHAIKITGGSNPYPDIPPEPLSAEPLFPLVDEYDLAYYKTLAGSFTTDTTFIGTPGSPIKPPGCPSSSCTDPSKHVYYNDEDISVQGTVKGQVLIVSAKQIHITGDIKKFSNSTWSTNPSEFSDVGGSNPNGSKAHQMILIAKNGVVIDEASVLSAGVDGDINKLTVETFIISPNTQIVIDDKLKNPAVYPSKDLTFNGAMILSNEAAFSAGFRGTREYVYDASLSDFPPPSIPTVSKVLAQIFHRSNFEPVPNPTASFTPLPCPSPSYGGEC